MKFQEPGAPLGGSANAALPPRSNWLLAILSFGDKMLVIAELEIRKLRHDATELFSRAIQPALWLLVFGQVFARTRAIPTGDIPYLDFMAPGILAQSVLFIAIFYGIAIIWERDLGVVHKLLVSPTPRAALVLGKALSASVRGLAQGAVVYALAALLGVRINWNPLALAGVAAAIVLGATTFSTFSLIIACIVKTRERFMGIGQVMTMPLFFASNAIYPISMMPNWLRVVAHVNPLTYEVDALRTLMLVQGTSTFGLAADYGVLLGATAIFVALGAWIYPNVVR
ncbi:MAG TPA: ABC transporter permease [Pirellulales bacterium]|nr:ABC transporter permease [Pirellulales bacterium]